MTMKTKEMNDIPANLLYNPAELEKWLDDTSVPLSDDELEDMAKIFDDYTLVNINAPF